GAVVVVRGRVGETAGLDVIVVERPDRIDSHRRQRALAFLKVSGAAADRATRAQAGTEDVDLTARLLPDLGRGGEVVSLRIGRVVVLVRVERVRRLLDDPARHRVVGTRVV